MHDQILTIAGIPDSEASLIKLVVIVGVGGLIALTWLVTTNIRRALAVSAKERTRRDIAAYVAEGSIAPDDAQKLLDEGNRDFEATISNAVAWGMISPQKAENLIRAVRERNGDRSNA